MNPLAKEILLLVSPVDPCNLPRTFPHRVVLIGSGSIFMWEQGSGLRCLMNVRGDTGLCPESTDGTFPELLSEPRSSSILATLSTYDVQAQRKPSNSGAQEPQHCCLFPYGETSRLPCHGHRPSLVLPLPFQEASQSVNKLRCLVTSCV